MKGLLYKEFCLTRNMWKLYAAVLAVFMALAWIGLFDGDLLFFIGSAMVYTGPVNVAIYDEQAKWESFAVTTPNGRTNFVRSKYLFALLLTAAHLLINLLWMLLLHGLGRQEWVDSLDACVCSVAGGMLFYVIALPVLFRSGAQKTQTLLAGLAIGAISGSAMLSNSVSISHGQVQEFYFAGRLAVFAVIAFCISYFLSLSIYSKKDL